MGRIRTIKPEFPQSESMGRISREARLLFILLWTLVDDSGRTRGDSRMLASLLYPYDEDSRILIEDWLGELEEEGCVVRYRIEEQTYLEICKWSSHQKIDKPTPSKYPAFDESSRILANPRRGLAKNSSGSRIKEGIKEGKGEDLEDSADAENSDPPDPPPSGKTKKIPTDRDPLRDALAESFKAKVPAYANPARENSSLLKLALAIRRKAEAAGVEPEVAARGTIEVFWRLHETGKPFYADFTPSKMLAILEGLWGEWAKAREAADTSWIDEALAKRGQPAEIAAGTDDDGF